MKSISVKEELYTLVPAACLYSTRQNAKCSVRFNFSGDFKYPLPAWHESYGNERVYTKQMKAIQLKKERQSDDNLLSPNNKMESHHRLNFT